MNHKQCKELCDNLRQLIGSLQWAQSVNLTSFDPKFKANLIDPLNSATAEYRKNLSVLKELERTCHHSWRRIRSEDGETHIKCNICEISEFVPSRDLGLYGI
jgi:hypothetical protein